MVTEENISMKAGGVKNISLSSNAYRLDVQFDEGRFLHIN